MTDNDDGEKASESRLPFRYQVAIVLIILGFLLMNWGFGLISGGMVQMSAANEWEDRNEGRSVTCENPTSDRCIEKLNRANENPYDGGGWKVLFGIILIPVGAAALYRGVNH